MRYIVVTGASKGIGKAIAGLFCNREKCGLALTYNTDYEGVREIAERLTLEGFFVLPVKMDVADEEQVKQGFDYIYKCFPRIDVLINNAGISSVKSFYETSYDDWKKVIEVDLNGMFLTTKQVIDRMNAEGFGVIFNISSVWGEVGASCEVAYSSAKAGVIGFSKALAKEYDLSIKAISVGFVDTTMNKHMTEQDVRDFLAENPKIKFRSPYYVANKILSYLDKEISKVENGFYLSNDKKDKVVLRIW